jgi:hypothetical protein
VRVTLTVLFELSIPGALLKYELKCFELGNLLIVAISAIIAIANVFILKYCNFYDKIIIRLFNKLRENLSVTTLTLETLRDRLSIMVSVQDMVE